MKKGAILFIAVFLIVQNSTSQNLDTFFKKYAKEQGVESVSVNGLFLKMATFFTDIDKEARGMISKMKSVKVITLEASPSTQFTQSFNDELNDVLEKNNFETVLESRDKNEKTYIYKRVTDKNNADMLVVTKEPGETNVVWIKGKLSEKEFNTLLSED